MNDSLLDQYIEERFCGWPFSDADRAALSKTFDFQCYVLRAAWREMLSELKKLFFKEE